MPFAATLDATQRAAGVAPKGSPRFERGKAIGQMLGGMGLMVLGGIRTGGGVAISLTQIGAAVGIPVAAMGVGALIAGGANVAAGMQGLLQSLSTGGSAGPPGVSAGPAAPVTHKHHIATNKNSVSDARGGPWTPRFEEIFKQAGMSMDDPANIVELPGHFGPHPETYHQSIFDRLKEAVGSSTGDVAKQALKAQLNKIRGEILTPGSVLNKLVTGK